MISGKILPSYLRLLFKRLADGRNNHGQDQHEADDDQHELGIYILLPQHDTDTEDDEGRDKAAKEIALAAGGRDTAENAHGDDLHFEAVTGRRIRSEQGAEQEDRADPGLYAHEGEGGETHLLHLDPGVFRRGLV